MLPTQTCAETTHKPNADSAQSNTFTTNSGTNKLWRTLATNHCHTRRDASRDITHAHQLVTRVAARTHPHFPISHAQSHHNFANRRHMFTNCHRTQHPSPVSQYSTNSPVHALTFTTTSQTATAHAQTVTTQSPAATQHVRTVTIHSQTAQHFHHKQPVTTNSRTHMHSL